MRMLAKPLCQVTEQHLKKKLNGEKWNVGYLSAWGCGDFRDQSVTLHSVRQSPVVLFHIK